MISNRIIEDDYKIKLFIKQFEDTLHDIKTPISIMYLLAKNLELSEDLPKNLRDDITIIKKYCNQVFNLLNEINNPNKVLGSNFKPRLTNCDIVCLTDDIVMSAVNLADRKNISITFDTDAEEKIMATDRDLYERILLNLISNAVKFTPENGYVDILMTDNDDEVIIDIIDNGTGFKEHEVLQIFNRYTTKHTDYNQNGTGIGLSIVKEMVEILGGRIEAKSCQEHCGAAFSITLPANLISDEDEPSSVTANFYQTKII